MDVSMAGGRVTDTRERAAVAGLVTAGVVLLAAGCASATPRGSAAATAATAATAPTAATAATAPTAATAGLGVTGAKYLAIARPANRELDHEFDGFGDHVKDGELAAAEADLRAATVTERRFDRQLIAISFPPRTEPLVRLLYRVNQARAQLTSTAAAAASLPELRGYQRRLNAANEPVEDAVRAIRGQLGLPPPDTS
jgi:hypothetical protein